MGLASIYDAEEYGVHVLPSRLFVIDGECHVVTAKVTGTPLNELLGHPTDELIESTDALYAGIGRYIIGAMNNGGYAGRDISSPGQYMHGTILKDTLPKTWLVDLPTGATNFAPAPYRDIGQNYNEDVMFWINGVVAAEVLADVRLENARSVAEQAFVESSSRTPRGKEWIGVFRFALEQHHELDIDESPIRDLLWAINALIVEG